jgi:hypothetical protein
LVLKDRIGLTFGLDLRQNWMRLNRRCRSDNLSRI